LLVPEATNGTGSAKVWRPYTPAMAAGLTDPVSTLQEGLLFRVPPWPQPQVVEETVPHYEHGSQRWTCTQGSAKRLGRKVESTFRVRITG